MRHGGSPALCFGGSTYTLRLAEDVYPNQPNVRRYTVELNAALFADPRFTVTTIGPFVLAIRKPAGLMATEGTPKPEQLASTSVKRRREQTYRTRSDRRRRRRSARRPAGDRHPAAAGQTDHRPTELAAERRARQRRSPADRLRGHRPEHQRAVPGRRRTGRTRRQRQDGAVVDGAQAGAQGRRPRSADPARQRRPGARRAQRPGGRRAVEPGAQRRVPAARLHRARRPGDRGIRRAQAGPQRRASRRPVAR